MAILASMYMKAEVLRALADTVQAKGEKGVELTISINDETNDYGQNLSSYVSQSKEDREAKKNRYYTGNGKVFWTDGSSPVVPQKVDKQAHASKKEYASTPKNDLPF
jgi:hypothetical protein